MDNEGEGEKQAAVSTRLDGHPGDHGPNGQFLPGNRCGRGSPLLKRQKAWREQFDKAMTDGDFRKIVRKLAEEAIKGEKWAVELVMRYTLPLPVDANLMDRLEELEQAILRQGSDSL